VHSITSPPPPPRAPGQGALGVGVQGLPSRSSTWRAVVVCYGEGGFTDGNMLLRKWPRLVREQPAAALDNSAVVLGLEPLHRVDCRKRVCEVNDSVKELK
jgi:hypothetical protein